MGVDETGPATLGGSEGDTFSTYRLSRAHVARAVGPMILTLGGLWLLVALLEAPPPVRTVSALVTVALMGLSLLLLLRPPSVLRLSSTGYRVSLVRGSAVRQASWAEVESVDTSPVGGALSLVLFLHDGRTSVVPLSLLGDEQQLAQRDVHERLNSAHGYRRFQRP